MLFILDGQNIRIFYLPFYVLKYHAQTTPSSVQNQLDHYRWKPG